MNDLHGELTDVRRRRESALAERRAIEAAPPTLAEVRERIEAAVTAMAASWRPVLADVLGTQPKPDPRGLLPTLTRDLFDELDGAAWRGLVCSIAGEAIIEGLVARAADALRARPESIAAPDRAAALAELGERLHGLEVLEERLVRELEAAGHDVDRRADADPVVVLGALEDANATRAA